VKEERWDDFLGVLLVAVSILIFASLVSHNPKDLDFISSPANAPIKNFVGIVGAYISGALHFVLGFSSYLVPILVFIWALNKFFRRSSRNFYIKLISTALLFLSASALFSMVTDIGPSTFRYESGGILGFYFSDIVGRYFGKVGSYIIVITLLFLSLLLATEFMIWPFVTAGIKKLIGFFANINFAPKPKEVKVKRAQPVIIPRIPKVEERPKEPVIKIAKPAGGGSAFGGKPEIKVSTKPKEPALVKYTPKVYGDYKLPGLDLLNSPPPIEERQIKEDLEKSSQILEETLLDFDIEAKVMQVDQGPTITTYELEPAPGIKVNRIVALQDDIALTMKAHSVRIVAPIPGKSRVGIEVPNSQGSMVYLKEVLQTNEYQKQQSEQTLPLVLGKDVSGTPILADLQEMPHLLIAGTTGSGKTVCVNSVIAALLFKASPDDIKFIMIDPKMVELAIFNGLPHLLCPVVMDSKKAAGVLAWAVNEMENRFKLLAKVGARNIGIYNEKIKSFKPQAGEEAEQELRKLPYIIILIDELADLMMIASQDVENAITRLAQLSRAVGIHLVLATQRPSVDVITGVIKANFPARISFKVASKVDSRTVLDMNGADKLLGKGDMLFLKPGNAKPIRAQSTLTSDDEIERIVNFVKAQRQPDYDESIAKEESKKFGKVGLEKDELFEEAARMIIETGQASVSMLQRRLGLGYTRAARLVDAMEEDGIVGPYRGSKPREILVQSVEELERKFKSSN